MERVVTRANYGPELGLAHYLNSQLEHVCLLGKKTDRSFVHFAAREEDKNFYSFIFIYYLVAWELGCENWFEWGLLLLFSFFCIIIIIFLSCGNFVSSFSKCEALFDTHDWIIIFEMDEIGLR